MIPLLPSLVFATGVGAASPACPAPPDLVAFVRQLDALRREARIPGLSVAVVKDERVVLALGLGEANVERHVPATAETPPSSPPVAQAAGWTITPSGLAARLATSVATLRVRARAT